MNIKAGIIFTSLLTLLSGVMYSQDRYLLDRLYDDFSSKLITLDFSYVIDMSPMDISGEGTVSFQDDAYHLSGNGIQVYCDGNDVWLLDTDSKEAYIEPVGVSSEAYMRNPALLFAGLKDNFKVVKSYEGGHSRGDGSKDVVFDLLPLTSCGIDKCSIQIKKDGTLYYGTFVMTDGQMIKVLIRSVAKSQKTDISRFRPSVGFDSSWIVTDLR